MKRHAKYIAIFFLILLAAVSVPRSMFHSLIHHDETEHIHCTDSENEQVSIEHEHCSFPQYSIPPFDPSIFTFQFHLSDFQEAKINDLLPKTTFDFCELPGLRGPPLS